MYIHHLIMAAHNAKLYGIHNWIMDIHNLQLSVGNVDEQFLTIMYIHKLLIYSMHKDIHD